MDTQVLVVGAGPVELTLAIALGQRGVRCTFVEQKEAPLGDAGVDPTPLQRAFAELNAPLAVMTVDDERTREICGHDILLLRPDLHVVWRGNRFPDEIRRLATVGTGHAEVR